MKNHLLLGFMLTLLSIASAAQSSNIPIPFLKFSPVVDGRPDKELDALEWRNFTFTQKTNNSNKDYDVRYKIGYSYSYLYLIIESSCDTISLRDRAYQNGDGFHMVVAKPNLGNSTDEFYVLAFSPANMAKNQAALKSVWYYNIDLSFKPLSASTKFECRTVNGKSYFELLLPWSDVYPYHPLFSDSVGLNLCFTKAVGSSEKNYYFMKYDKKIQWEQSRREYNVASFEQPKSIDSPATFARLLQRNSIAGKPLTIRMTSLSPSARSCRYTFSICSADSYTYSRTVKELQLPQGVSTTQFELTTTDLAPGGYRVIWRTPDGQEGEIPISLLPEISQKSERASLALLKGTISEGDYNTMSLMLNSILKEYSSVKAYETAGNVREAYLTYHKLLADLPRNRHLLSERPGVSRRAFLSAIDSTLQPYSVKLPQGYNPSKKYPLFVMLHGSGATDQGTLNGNLTDGKYIEIAPLGRGTSNCYTVDNAQIDVKEAIDDAVKNFSVDTSKMVIAGFSMGGYGAYRIFYEYPKLFKCVVDFSGQPNNATEWLGKGYPDFLDPKYLKPFRSIPVFVYHSKNDLNCPFELTRQLVEKLKKTGAKVQQVTTEEEGHGVIDSDNIGTYYQWLRNTVGE